MPPKSFPLRNSDDFFPGTCYEKPVSSFDASDPTRAPPPRVVRERPGWDDSIVVTHGLDGHRPRSAAPAAKNRRRQEAARARRGSQRERPRSAEGSTFGVSNLGQHTGWGAQESTLYESSPANGQSVPSPTRGTAQDPKPPDSDWSVDLTPEQAKAFVEFVTLLSDVESSGSMSMVHLAQAAVDQATAQKRRSRLPTSHGGL